MWVLCICIDSQVTLIGIGNHEASHFNTWHVLEEKLVVEFLQKMVVVNYVKINCGGQGVITAALYDAVVLFMSRLHSTLNPFDGVLFKSL